MNTSTPNLAQEWLSAGTVYGLAMFVACENGHKYATAQPGAAYLRQVGAKNPPGNAVYSHYKSR